MNGLDLLGMAVLVGLLLAWSRQRGCDNNQARVETEHRQRINMLAFIDELTEARVRACWRERLAQQEQIRQAVEEVFAGIDIEEEAA